ncbi:MAG: hypothetical protein U9N73_13715 [Candidatus Auribacterota bacterium]|nr:hypothetical protein [Candidatus Auribacterota bacterium]
MLFKISLKENTRRGFTLMELIIFIVLAGLLIPVVILAFSQGIRGMNIPTMVAEADFAAQEKMEWFLQYPYGASQLTPGYGADEVTINGEVYSRKWRIRFYNPGYPSPGIDGGYKQIDVFATTDELPRVVELHTLITRR